MRLVDDMKPKLVATEILDRVREGRWPWSPRREDPVAASMALALAIELMRALRDRGLLSGADLDDLLAEAGAHFAHGQASQLIGEVRSTLERREDD